MTNNDMPSSYALVEAPRFADCRFYAQWLSAAADAEGFWTEALQDKSFAQQVGRLICVYIPSFENSATLFLMRLQEMLSTIIVDIESDKEGSQFAMMVALEFFQRTGHRYQMTIPSDLTIGKVRNAALAVAETADEEEWLHLENLIVSMPVREAKDWQHKLLHMDQGEREAKRLVLMRARHAERDTSGYVEG